MQSLLGQIGTAGLPFIDVQEHERLGAHTGGPRMKRNYTIPNLPPSPAESMMVDSQHATDCSLPTKEEKCLTRNFDRGAPGDAAIFSSSKTPEQKELSKRKSQYYGDVFASRESNTSARERIHRDSIVMADVRTNVIVNDEYSFITDLSYNLSSRYQRPESSILVTITHSACLLLGGSFDPAYTMTITALPSQVKPVTNKRNSILMAKILEESLGVSPSRGLIKFVAVQEENLAFNGRTVATEIEELEKEHAETNTNLKRSLSRTGAKTATKRQSMRSMRSLKTGLLGGNGPLSLIEPRSPISERSGRLTPPLSERDTPPPLPAMPLLSPCQFDQLTTIPLPPVPEGKTTLDKKAEKMRKISHRKSFISSLFGR